MSYEEYEIDAAMNCADALLVGTVFASEDNESMARLQSVLDGLLQVYPNAVAAMLERNTQCARSAESKADLQAHADNGFDDFVQGLQGRVLTTDEISDHLGYYIYDHFRQGFAPDERACIEHMMCIKAFQHLLAAHDPKT